jgi:hypothetical protein
MRWPVIGLTLEKSPPHPVRSGVHVLVLPDPDDGPSLGRESAVDPPVPPDVESELGCPVLAIVSGNIAMLRAGVPETAIHEHGDFWPAKNYVRSYHERLCAYGRVDAVPQPELVEGSPEIELRTGIAPAIARHTLRDASVTRNRIWRSRHYPDEFAASALNRSAPGPWPGPGWSSA